MKWKVIGAHRHTGEDVVREYDAKDEQAATAWANLDGIIISEVVPVRPAPDRRTPTEVPQPVAQATSLAYSTPSTPSEPVPTYAGLAIAGGVLRVYAIVCYVLGGLAVVGAGVGIVMDVSNGRSFGFSLAVNVMGMLTPALLLLFAAAIAHGLSAACVALRDIARNSWR